VRQIRESSYYILYSLTRFPDFFYSIPDLPGPLSSALFDNASALSAHHLSVLLSVSTHLIEGCPSPFRAQFLPLVIEGLFRELDKKISSEWDAVNRQVAQAGENDNLANEMKTESILRQLTYSSVSLVASLVDPRNGMSYCRCYKSAMLSWPHPFPNSLIDPSRLSQDGDKRNRDVEETPMHVFILSTPMVLEPILLFCNSTLRVRDTRSVVTTVRVFRSLIPRFRDKSPIRDFFCTDVLKNAISSLHEPYFVDCQRELASLIAAIILVDEEMPRSILLSLPGLSSDVARVDRRLTRLRAAKSSEERLQRSIVLDLLSSLRGVSIHELGKIERAKPRKKSAFQEQYMSVDSAQPQMQIVRGESPGLEGVAGMFEDGNGV
jgi:exportin-5